MNKTSRLAALTLAVFAGLTRADDGPAIPISPGDQPTVVTKLRVTDCRAVRGFVGAPVDGSLHSASWDGKTWEYPTRGAGAGVGYGYHNGDGLHLTFADDQGFNAVLVRGGIKAKLLRDVQQYDDPSTGQLLHEFPGHTTSSHAWFPAPVRTSHVSFFDVSDGLIADCSFFRTHHDLGNLASAEVIPLTADPLPAETPLAAIGVSFDATKETPITISIKDPLNPRLELFGADFIATAIGPVHVICDFPDQIIPAGTKLDVTVTLKDNSFPKDLKLTQYRIPRSQALPEAFEYRKFLLHALYSPISEARPWNTWNLPGDDEKYFAKPTLGDPLQDRLRPFVHEIVMTLGQCRALDPEGKDPVVRQMDEWMHRKMLAKSSGGLPAFPTKFDHADGIPEWASLVHQAWMQAREIPRWWIEHRQAPNGELGGEVGDDTDMFGNYAPFPMFERDGVGGLCLAAGERLAELADHDNLVSGINKQSMDPLHAYEEGMNQEALMAYWNYGDPVYLERCMAAARSTERLTMLTAAGHRHFISNNLGWDQVRKPEPPEREHGTHSLMWHPALATAWYNRNPLAMKWLSEWGDGWLAHMKPNEYGNAVSLPDDLTTKSDPLPFQGGWGMTGSVFTFLADLTGDPRFIRPYLDAPVTKGDMIDTHLAELLQMGMIPDPQKLAPEMRSRWNTALYLTGDKRPLITAIKKDIEELQRFPYMYTAVECYTDRVFLYPIVNPAIAYTGGYTTRNKLNLTYAVTWDGFGTDYAALVTAATPDHLKVLLVNLSDHPLTGRGRLWRLAPGDYELTLGPDADNDDRPDDITRRQTLSVTKGDDLTLTLPPHVVQVLELKQLRKSTPIYDRADLALSPRELRLTNGTLTGVAHNIGSKDVTDVVVALIDNQGRTIQTQHLGSLPAPLDLRPRTLPFQFNNIPPKTNGWSVSLDPTDALPELFEGNNRASLPTP